MNTREILNNLLTEDGKKRAVWILIKSGFMTSSDIQPEKPVLDDDKLSEYELNIFDTIESLIYVDEYERAYQIAVNAIKNLIRSGKYKSALYICQMVGDEILRREILREGVRYYESRGDFRNAMDFAIALGDVNRYKTYEYLYKLYRKIYDR